MSDLSPYIDSVYAPYGLAFGGKWYYRQNKPGTRWFDNVSNEKGWTVDFNLEVIRVENSDVLSRTDPPRGIGIYVNDGERDETIYFLEQEVLFSNAVHSVTYDTTSSTSYRLIGKDDGLRLFARRDTSFRFTELGKVSFGHSATNAGNGYMPAVCEDSSGNLHAAWHDDGNATGQIYYGKNESGTWGTPELIAAEAEGGQNASIAIDSNGVIFVAYETKESNLSSIAVVYKTANGWSDRFIVGGSQGLSVRPKLSIDNQNNVHMVWEDHRYIHPEVMYTRWDESSLSWIDEQRVTNTSHGAFRPVVGTYLGRVYVAWDQVSADNSGQSVHTRYYDYMQSAWSDIVEVTDTPSQAGYPDLVVTNSGRVFVTWHDNVDSYYEIYARIMNHDLDALGDVVQVTNSVNDSKFPSISEHVSTGDVSIAWQDYRDVSNEYLTSSPYVDPYVDRYGTHIFAIRYDNSEAVWYSSGQGSFDTLINFSDNRVATNPATPKTYSGDMHILYASEMAKQLDAYLLIDQVFSHIMDAVFDLDYVASYSVQNDEYVERDIDVSGTIPRKEIRFGDFSDTLSCKFRFKDIKYYLNDAVEPFEITPVTGQVYNIDDINVQDAAINGYGDAWMASMSGVKFFFKDTRALSDATGMGTTPNVIAMTFDQNNRAWAATADTIYYSDDHIAFSSITVTDLGSQAITTLGVDNNNNLLIGTQANGLFIVETSEFTGTLVAAVQIQLEDDLPSVYVTAVAVDSIGAMWIGTRGGLARYYNDRVTNFTKTNGLASNRVNDIAIRNTAIRYIATSNGISKMVGTSFEHLTAESANLHNNNVKSIAWREPNVIMAGTLSTLNQILVKDDESVSTTTFAPEFYSTDTLAFDDRKIFYIVTDTGETIPDDSLVEVYLNGNRITHGFEVSVTGGAGIAIRFETDLLTTDVIDVIIRKDIRLLTSFAQTDAERAAVGSRTIRVKQMGSSDNGVYLVTEGDVNEVKLNDSTTPLPHDLTHLDTTPPTGKITISEQIDSHTVRVIIEDATDGSGSGLDTMVVSNYTNFTSDGSVPQTPVPFATSAIHDLGSALTTITDSLTFTTGDGNGLFYFPTQEELYATTSKPARIYKLNNATGAWSTIITYGDDEYLDFVARFNNKFIVGVGHDSGSGKIYSYTDDGTFSTPLIRFTTGSRPYCAAQLNSILYIGTGSDGKIYSFDGNILSEILSGLSSNIYSLTVVNNILFAGTGEAGRIYRIDVDEPLSTIIHSDGDTAVTAISNDIYNSKTWVFAGTSSEGKIVRSNPADVSFNSSFQTSNAKVSSIKSPDSVTYAAIGDTVFYLSINGTWTWKYTHSEAITDIAILTDTSDPQAITDTLYVVSESKVTKISPVTTSKDVYLKLVDKAGNETALFDSEGDLVADLFDSISITDLVGYISENKLLELDELGNVISSVSGDSQFFSAEKIEQEQGVYESQIFNGSNDLLKWDQLSWQATQPSNTSVSLYVRASSSRTDILLEDWIGPYTISDASGVDLGFLTGQFIQFKAVLISQVKGVSPTLHSVVIRTVTAEAIHFFTTNFILGSRLRRGILTSEKMVPVSADVVFGVNTTDSVEWSDYQIIDENRVFNSDQTGENMRVGIRLLSPGRSTLTPSDFDEYGPYNTSLFINTVDFLFQNTGPSAVFNFRVTLYSDIGLQNPVFQIYSGDDQSNFSVDGEDFPASGQSITSGESAQVLYNVPGSANINCSSFYFVKIESYNGSAFETISDDYSFISGCSASFVDIVDFDFSNSTGSAKDFHFRIRFYTDTERTTLYKTVYSGNDRDGWSVDSAVVPEGGVQISNGEKVSVVYSPVLSDFEANKLYYTVIDAYDGSAFVLASNSYTFQANDITSLIYCGPYYDVPVVKNFALLFELLDNNLLTLNLS
jgi:hypothetical protein